MDTNKDYRKLYNIFFLTVLIMQIAMIIYAFQVKKEGWHSDEVWSYGYANSYYQPFIYCDAEQQKSINMNEWVDSGVLTDYVTVNPDERFAYKSIVYNLQKDKLHVPLYFVILHTICSFFPGKFSFWYAFSINLVSYVIMFIYLRKLCTLLKNEKFALLVCTFFGFSSGAVDNFIYIRMYAMETALLLMMLYFMVKIVRQKSNLTCNADTIGLFIASVLGFMTHMYFISIAGILTFLFCVYFLAQKKVKKMVQFGLLMLSALIVMSVIYPYFWKSSLDWFCGVRSKNEAIMNYNFRMRIIYVLNLMLGKEFNFWLSYYKTGYLPIILGVLIYIALCLIPLIVWMRNSDFVRKIRESFKQIWMDRKKIAKRIVEKVNWVCVMIGFACMLQVVAVSETSHIAIMAYNADRYIFHLYPLFVTLIILFVYWIIKKIIGKIRIKNKYIYKPVFMIMLSGIFILNCIHVCYASAYYFDSKRDGKGLYEETRQRNVIIFNKSSFLLTALIPYINDSEVFFHVDDIDNYKLYMDEYKKKVDNGPTVLIMCLADFYNYETEEGFTKENIQKVFDEEAYQAVLDDFDKLVPDTKMEYLTSEEVFTREMKAYLINP